MKMVMIVYNEAMDMEVMELLESCAMKNFTKFNGVYGKGATSGTHLGTEIWPGRNNMLIIACDEKQSKQMLLCVKEIKKSLGLEGVKAFVMPIDEMV